MNKLKALLDECREQFLHGDPKNDKYLIDKIDKVLYGNNRD